MPCMHTTYINCIIYGHHQLLIHSWNGNSQNWMWSHEHKQSAIRIRFFFVLAAIVAFIYSISQWYTKRDSQYDSHSSFCFKQKIVQCFININFFFFWTGSYLLRILIQCCVYDSLRILNVQYTYSVHSILKFIHPFLWFFFAVDFSILNYAIGPMCICVKDF